MDRMGWRESDEVTQHGDHDPSCVGRWALPGLRGPPQRRVGQDPNVVLVRTPLQLENDRRWYGEMPCVAMPRRCATVP